MMPLICSCRHSVKATDRMQSNLRESRKRQAGRQDDAGAGRRSCRRSHRKSFRLRELGYWVGPELNRRHTDFHYWVGPELNRRHTDFQSVALPTELPTRDGLDPSESAPLCNGRNRLARGLSPRSSAGSRCYAQVGSAGNERRQPRSDAPPMTPCSFCLRRPCGWCCPFCPHYRCECPFDPSSCRTSA
jgi:hypothetical protein